MTTREIPVLGETDGERRWFAQGYRMGMIRANEILNELAKETGEVVGACPAGPYREAYNRLSVEIPTGEISVRYTMKPRS